MLRFKTEVARLRSWPRISWGRRTVGLSPCLEQKAKQTYCCPAPGEETCSHTCLEGLPAPTTSLHPSRHSWTQTIDLGEGPSVRQAALSIGCSLAAAPGSDTRNETTCMSEKTACLCSGSFYRLQSGCQCRNQHFLTFAELTAVLHKWMTLQSKGLMCRHIENK